MRKSIFMLIIILLLPSCSFFNSSGLKKIDSYYTIVDSWIGRPIGELIIYWKNPVSVKDYSDKSGYFRGKTEKQKEYEWTFQGEKYKPRSCLFCFFSICKGPDPNCEVETISCETSALVDKNGSVIDIQPQRHNEGICSQAVYNQTIYIPKAPEKISEDVHLK